MTLKDRFLKWRTKIIAILVVLLCMCQCSTCINTSIQKYQRYQYEQTIDSLQTALDSTRFVYKVETDSLKNEIEKSQIRQSSMNCELKSARITIKTVQESNKNLTSANQEMVKQITKQVDTIK